MTQSTRCRRLPIGVLVLATGFLAACGGGGGGGGSSSDGADPEPPPLAWYVFLAPAASVDGQAVGRNDLVTYEPDSGDTSVDSVVSTAPASVDAFARVDDETFYFSLDCHAIVGGIPVSPGDILLSDAGAVSVAVAVDTLGLPDGVNLDALARTSGGDFVFSTDVHFTAGGTAYEDADLIRYDGADLSMYASAATLGLADATDIDGVSLREGGELFVSLKTAGALGSDAYDHGHILQGTASGGLTAVALDSGDALSTRADVVALDDNRE